MAHRVPLALAYGPVVVEQIVRAIGLLFHRPGSIGGQGG